MNAVQGFRDAEVVHHELHERLSAYHHLIDLGDASRGQHHLALAALFERLDQPKRALKRYLRAAELDPGDALACFQAALIEVELKHGAAALTQLEEALKRDPALLDAYLTAGAVCQDHLDKPRKAIEFYEKYLAAGGKDERVLLWIEELR